MRLSLQPERELGGGRIQTIFQEGNDMTDRQAELLDLSSLSISWCYFVTDVSIHILTRYAIHKISLWASKDSRATSTKAEKTRGHKWEDIDCLWAINLLLSTFDGLNQVSSFGNSREISKIRWVTPLTHKLIYNVCRPIAIRDPSIQVYDQH